MTRSNGPYRVAILEPGDVELIALQGTRRDPQMAARQRSSKLDIDSEPPRQRGTGPSSRRCCLPPFTPIFEDAAGSRSSPSGAFVRREDVRHLLGEGG